MTYYIIDVKMDEFEEKLLKMTKPEVDKLKHESMLAQEIIKAKEKSVLSLWWISLPLYVVAMFLMKALFDPEGNFFLYLYEFVLSSSYKVVILFYVLPLVMIWINAVSVWRVYFLAGGPPVMPFLRFVWFNILMILLSLFLLVLTF